MTRAEQLRKEADDIEAAEFKTERLKTADTIPTCQNCGGRSFKIYAWTVVSQSIAYDQAEDKDGGEWGEDYEGGDHTEQSESAMCNRCAADVRPMLETFGWTFYGEPEALALSGSPVGWEEG